MTITYTVIVEHSPDYRRPERATHRPIYRGDDLSFARHIARHYNRPIDNISAVIVETTIGDDGWAGERVIT